MGEAMLWLIVSIVCIVIDIITSSFIFMWFSVGGIVAIILSMLGVPMIGQVIVFLFISILMLSVGYPWAKKKFKVDKNTTPTMEQTYIGKVMTAVEDINEINKIKVSGIYWTAYNKGKQIKAGDKFEIIGIEGNKLLVKLKED